MAQHQSTVTRLEASWEALTRHDDVLADILIRLPTLADLGRAAVAYAAFRRVITSRYFNRRLRALHPPSLLGVHALCTGFYPVEPPHPSAAAARDLAASADFGFTFLPALGSGCGWMVRDVRDGRFLVDCDSGNGVAFTTVAVCDPLYRRYVLLPPIPQDLASAVQQPHLTNAERRCQVFLISCSEEEEAAVAAGSPELFKVMWMAECPAKLVAFVFSSASWQWQAVASRSWRELNPEILGMTDMPSLFWRNYAYGCFYWLLSNCPKDCQLLVLNTSTMEFTTTKSPFGGIDKEFAMVELGDGKLGMFVSGDLGCFHLKFLCGRRHSNGETTFQWPWKRDLFLSSSNKYDMLGASDGKLFLQAREDDGSTGKFGSCPIEFKAARGRPKFRGLHDCGFTGDRQVGCFSIDFITRERQNVRSVLGNELYPLSALYTGYPPSLSPPAI
jgi:hypothetical protein